MHILFAYKQFPAPSVGHAGGEALFRLMEALHRRGHRLTLVARIRDEELTHLPVVRSICEGVYTVPHHRSLAGPRPLAFARSYIALRGAIRRAIRTEAPDFVHVETTQTALTALGLCRVPCSYRTQDVNWFLAGQQLAQLHGARRWPVWIRWAFLRMIEPWICRKYDLVLAISEGDRALLAQACAQGRIDVVPLTPAVRAARGHGAAVAGEANVLFVGAMSRDHNVSGIVWFLDHVWPIVARQVPEARLYIVGRDPPVSLQARMDPPGVVVTGAVDDLAPWYRAAAVFVSPLLVAGGLLQKVMDAMAMGVPVVATCVCNHGIGAVPGEHLVIADDPEHFAYAVVGLLKDPSERSRIATAAQQFVVERYDLEVAVDRFDRAIHNLVADYVRRRA